jgi:hypothetical protein
MFGLKRFRIRLNYHEIVRPWLKVLFKDIEQIIIQQQFTTSPKDFILLCEITWKSRFDDPQERLAVLKNKIEYFNDFTIIRSEKNKRLTLCFIKGIHDERYTELFMFSTVEFLCFIEFPIYIREEFGIVNLVGLPEDVNRLIEFMKEFGSTFEIIAVKNYYPRDIGILSVLTEKQLSVLKQAHKLGFFDHPRKISAREISKKLGIAHTTFLTHIRKSQKRLFSALFGN